MTVAHVGHFDPGYSRNRIVAKALRRAGAEVVTITDPRTYLRRTPYLAREIARRRDIDLVFVGFPGHADMALARLVARRRRVPVVFDAFVSLFETEEDRRGDDGVPAWRGCRYLLEDRLACRLADRVVVDTDTHLRHFVEHLRIPPYRLRRIWVGADDDVMRPGPRSHNSRFRVFVYSSFIPLHGLEYVVRAARVLERSGEDVAIDVVGSGETEGAIRQLADQLQVRTVTFLGPRRYEELPALMSAADVCLGIFGTSPKAGRVIPNKVFDALAVARPVITSTTAAAREVLVHRETAFLCPAGNSDALAEALAVLKGDPTTRDELARRGHELFREQFSIDALAAALSDVVLDVTQ